MQENLKTGARHPKHTSCVYLPREGDKFPYKFVDVHRVCVPIRRDDLGGKTAMEYMMGEGDVDV